MLARSPQQDGGENWKGKSEKTGGLREEQFHNWNKILINCNEKENNKGREIKPKTDNWCKLEQLLPTSPSPSSSPLAPRKNWEVTNLDVDE